MSYYNNDLLLEQQGRIAELEAKLAARDEALKVAREVLEGSDAPCRLLSARSRN